MKYRDRQGRTFEKTTSQDAFLAEAYSSALGRGIMKFLSLPIFSKCLRYILNSKLSAGFVYDFAEKNGIDLFDYEQKNFVSFNDFFTRKIKEGRRFVTGDDSVLVSPADGKVSVYEITNSNFFVIKNSVYNVDSLLRDKKLAERYMGGYALIVRLSVDDYHRYIYPCSGYKSHDRHIKGFLHTVNPVVNRYVPVYKENSRTYCMLRSDNFGDVIQMEVGALMVGKISNANSGKGKVRRGEEKGYFEFGGSTIVLLLEKDKAEIYGDLIKNTQEGCETIVRQGEPLAVRKY